MKYQPCFVTYEGFRYKIKADGSVFGALAQDGSLAVRNEPLKNAFYMDPVVEPAYAAEIRREAARQRRNRAARERTQSMKDLGLKRAKGGAFGGWE